MADFFDEIIAGIGSLTDEQRIELLSRLNATMPKEKVVEQTKETTEPKVKEKKTCPHCGSTDTKKHGFKNNKQRYRCKACGKTFSEHTNHMLKGSNLSEGQWKEIIRGVLENLTLSRIASNSGVSVKTAWFSKQKICKALSEVYEEQDKFIDIAECDEYYMTLSFRGKRDPDFFINTLGRMPRHHRTYQEKIEYLMKNGFWDELSKDPERLEMLLYRGDTKLRGISKEQTCVLTCKDRNNNLYINPVSIGRLETSDLKEHLSGRFASDAILVTDSHPSYPSFAQSERIQLEQIESGKHSKGAYNLGRINALHSRLSKHWPRQEEREPATKYLDLNLALFRWMEKNAELTIQEKVNKVYEILTTNNNLTNVKFEDIVNRELTINTKGLIPKKV